MKKTHESNRLAEPHNPQLSKTNVPVREVSTYEALWKPLFETATLLLAIIALIGQWKAARTANDLNISNFKSGQRAYVGVNGQKSNLDSLKQNSKVAWHVTLHNFGNSPATDVRVHFRLIAFEEDPDFSVANEMSRSLELDLGNQPSSTLFNGQELTNTGVGIAVTNENLASLAQNKISFLLIGAVRYSDIFSPQHHTFVCRRALFAPDGKYIDLLACPGSEDID